MDSNLTQKVWELPLNELRDLLDVIQEMDWLILQEYQRTKDTEQEKEWRKRMVVRAHRRERFYALKLESLRPR